MIMQMLNQMEMDFEPLPKTLFFEYQNIGELTQYFLANHHSALIEVLES